MTPLEIPVESHEWRLFQRLEAAFQDFLELLPPGLKDLARQVGTYHGDDSLQPLKGLGDLNPVLVSTPWLFRETFQLIDDDLFLRISEAGMFFVLASVVLDHLVDGQTGTPGLHALYHQALYSRGVSGYRLALHTQSPFWDYFERLAAEHLASLAAETMIQEQPADYSYETLTAIAHGKVAPIVTTLAGLCAASGQMNIMPCIESSLKHISVASQLLDDIGDWQADVQNRHFTYFLAFAGEPETWSHSPWPDVEKVQLALDAGWIDVIQLKRVMQGLNQAIEAVQGLDCSAWVRYVDGYRVITNGHLERCILRHLQTVFK